jgi:hypothetical protein
MRAPLTAVFALSAVLSGCGGTGGPTTMVPLLQAAGMPITQTPGKEIPLEVVTRSTGIRDPLPVEGTSVTYGDVETALGHSVSSAAVPWADAHRAQRPEGWQIAVELINADASYRDGRLLVTLGVRATLRTRATRTYIAQTQAYCRQGAVVPLERGAPVVFACMERIGRDLAGWLGQIDPASLASASDPSPRAPAEP